MKFGAVLPFGDASDVARYAAAAEQSGWDGIFVAEGLWGVDAWISLATAAVATERIRLGTLLTPVPRIRPWDLASRVGTVDRLSGGRAILSAGLGALHDGWLAFERGTRVELLEECLAIYDGLMRGQPFSFSGHHYQVHPTTFAVPDPPVQQPRPPVWVVGVTVEGRARQPSLARAAHWDGLLPEVVRPDGRHKVASPDELAGIVARATQIRVAGGQQPDGYDVIVEADSYRQFRQMTCTDPGAWEQAGATWWIESWWNLQRADGGERILLDRLASGPPR
jgi:alkanesulfonate monooxygenase SsuD/methylene tetrahydromethanopterin reductase-like flavin-dependent oxidoreductase (luciferase family)